MENQQREEEAPGGEDVVETDGVLWRRGSGEIGRG
jgi:hypothetical protein